LLTQSDSREHLRRTILFMEPFYGLIRVVELVCFSTQSNDSLYGDVLLRSVSVFAQSTFCGCAQLCGLASVSLYPGNDLTKVISACEYTIKCYQWECWVWFISTYQVRSHGKVLRSNEHIWISLVYLHSFISSCQLRLWIGDTVSWVLRRQNRKNILK